MGRLDRDELLARTDLEQLVTEISGTPRGRGRGARWHCANPDHPDENPSMGIYTGKRGQRWKCHACGAGGTAIDLLMIAGAVPAGEAIHDLARRLGIDPPQAQPTSIRVTVDRRAPAAKPARVVATIADPAIDDFVAAAEQLLWEPVGQFARRTLAERGFSERILRANRVGFDPGPGFLPRPEGLPRSSPGIVYPVLEPATGRAVYYQVRTLSPSKAADRKYDQPTAERAPNPKLAVIQTTHPPTTLTIVTEGIPDGLTVAEAGLSAIAVLGVSHAAADSVDSLARLILSRGPAAGYAICFDPDTAGLGSGARLAGQLAQHGVNVARLLPPEPNRDLNAWWQADPEALKMELAGTVAVLGL